MMDNVFKAKKLYLNDKVKAKALQHLDQKAPKETIASDLAIIGKITKTEAMKVLSIWEDDRITELDL
jgi:hypothetical protein